MIAAKMFPGFDKIQAIGCFFARVQIFLCLRKIKMEKKWTKVFN